ncbi:MAG: LptF/LptG family permease [Parvularculaceae bacterium]|nr:LptF/LptG family permease [Parvularculaceae bacterium]
MRLIDRYILRAVLTPLGVCLLIAGMLLLLEQMLRLFDFVLAEKGPVDVVWRMLANLVPHYMGLALPLGVLLGIMLAFRNLSLSSELDAMNSGGLSATRLLQPVYGLVFLVMALDFLLVSYLEPIATFRYEKIRFDVTSGALGIKIPQGEFVSIGKSTTIRLGKANKATRDAEDIYIERRNQATGQTTTITARYGGISANSNLTRLMLKLKDGRQITFNPKTGAGAALRFDRFDLELELPAIAVFRNRGGIEEESTINELFHKLNTTTPASDPKWHEYRAGFHWRLIHPLTFLVIPILAVALGVTSRRRTSNIKPVLGVAILIIYHEILEEWGVEVARQGLMSPYISMWGVFAVFLVFSVMLYRGSIDRSRTARVSPRRDDDGTVRVVGGGKPKLHVDAANPLERAAR